MLDLSIDRLVWYAGWADKITQVTGNANPVAGPFFNLSTPEPTGVVGVVAPQQSSLLGLVSVVAPVVVTGNTAVVLSSYERPAARRDVLRGAGHLRRPRRRGQHPHRHGSSNTAPTLASHMDVNAIDLTGFAGDTEQARALEEAAAENLKRVLRPPATEPDWTLEPGIERMTTFLETKTVWHPIGV